MARPKGSKNKAEVAASVESKKESSKDSKASMADKLEQAVLGDYQEMFTTIPNRRENLFNTGIPGLDYILGGGFPRGQMIHVYGPEGCGKTTLMEHITAAIQKQAGKVLYLDVENSLDLNQAKALGIDTSVLGYIKKVPSGEVALDMIEKAIRANLYQCIIVDSIAALTPAEIINGSNQDATIGVKARMISKALEKLNNAAVNADTIIIFVNQLRANIQTGYGVRPFTTPGGKALPFFANVNIYMQKIGPVKDGDIQIGQQVKIRVEKNKIAPPMKDVICNLVYGQGFRRDMDLILSAKDRGIIALKGSWYTMGGEQLGQGLPGVVSYANSHPEFLDMLEGKLYGTKESITEESTGEVVPGNAMAVSGAE